MERIIEVLGSPGVFIYLYECIAKKNALIIKFIIKISLVDFTSFLMIQSVDRVRGDSLFTGESWTL